MTKLKYSDAAPFPCVRCGGGNRCQQVEVKINAVTDTTTLCLSCRNDLERLLNAHKDSILNFLAERPEDFLNHGEDAQDEPNGNS